MPENVGASHALLGAFIRYWTLNTMETSFLFVFVVIPKNPVVHEEFINNFLSIPYTKAKIPAQSKYQDFVLGLKKIVFFHDDSFKRA